MFRPGEIAKTRTTGRIVTIKESRIGEEMETLFGRTVSVPYPILTDQGLFDETDLHPAHPSIFAWQEEVDPLAGIRARIHKEGGAGTHIPYDNPLRGQIEAIVEKLKAAGAYDFNGHWKNGGDGDTEERKANLRDYLFERGHFYIGHMNMADAQALADAAERGETLDHWVSLCRSLITSSAACSYCGADCLEAETNGAMIRIKGACTLSDGFPPNEWELNVPSGKIVIANDLRQLFPVMGDRNINKLTEQRATSLDYAATGMSHGFVGNSCPGVYQTGKVKYKVANHSKSKRRVAGICTDLWWYSMCDLDEFKRRCEHFRSQILKEGAKGDLVEVALKHWGCTVIDVVPGVYRFRHFDEVSDDYRKQIVYATFERVRKPDPVVDFLAAYNAYTITPGQYMRNALHRYPTLYGAEIDYWQRLFVPWEDMTKEQRLSTWQRVADHLFCTIGGGVDWHEKGFPRERLEKPFEDCPVPTRAFRRQCHWYPMSEGYSTILVAANIKSQYQDRQSPGMALSPEFAKLGFEVLESIISFGETVRDDNRCREVDYARKRMLLAVEAYRKLAVKYPEQADPDMVAWLNDGDRAEKWVAGFDLGPKYMAKHRKHIQAQKWVPDDTYAVAFDARKLKDGHFAWHPENPGCAGCWSSKENAQRYAIETFTDNGQEGDNNCFWSGNAGKSVPLYSVARVVKTGTVSHMGERIIEVEYDYGTPMMLDKAVRKGFKEAPEKAAIRLLTREDYEALLPEAEAFFNNAEAEIQKKVQARS